ncbi:MAG: DUF1311 domain-containing protein [Magnetococcales bacterium]|nr:DUF1311 domain-containing protein [Magnetococcales bacterium]MBF0114517.1 DUF1311 domain-containing protein [Magnetococcales bacterium]
MRKNVVVGRCWALLCAMLYAVLVASELWAGGKASFDCGKAASAVEKMICGDANLAAADGALGELYQQALRASGDKERLKSQQLAWLKQVRNPCSTVACLQSAYQHRLQALAGSGAGGDGGVGALFPAVYVGGFTGKETLTFKTDGVLMTEEGKAGRYQTDKASPWPEARYPLLLIQGEQGNTEERHCKIQPDLRRLICDDGGSIAAEYVRQGSVPAGVPEVATRCDGEQLYLDVMAAARKARPQWELKGSTSVTQDKPGHCLISLYYLNNGKAIDLQAAYDLHVRPVVLHLQK